MEAQQSRPEPFSSAINISDFGNGMAHCAVSRTVVASNCLFTFLCGRYLWAVTGDPGVH